MIENLELALSLMIIGMATVAIILFMVVAGGKIMIRIVNRYFPDREPEMIFMRADQNKLAALIATVNIATGGKGKIEKIDKIE